jgi:hypothetical protein
MDCVPVDETASSIVRLTLGHNDGLSVSHLVAHSPRHWRECVLWMRLCGYDLELIPYRDWINRLDATGRDHPLFPLRSFFTVSIAEEGGLTLPELFEEGRAAKGRRRANSRNAPRYRRVGIERRLEVARPLLRRLHRSRP